MFETDNYSFLSDLESGEDDQRHTHIIRRDKRGGHTEAGSEFEAEFEKFYAEEKVDIVDASDEVVIKSFATFKLELTTTSE